jgi:hypothetical protein
VMMLWAWSIQLSVRRSRTVVAEKKVLCECEIREGSRPESVYGKANLI